MTTTSSTTIHLTNGKKKGVSSSRETIMVMMTEQ